MADEVTTTDTQESPTTDAPAEGATEQQAATDAQSEETTQDATDAGDDEGTALGGPAEKEEAGEEEGKSEDEAKPEIPEKYELSLTDADGNAIELDTEALEAADPVFRELGLSNEQANQLMPVAAKFAERTAEATLKSIMDAGAEQKASWLSDFKADPEIGGAKYEETLHLAAKGLDALGYPEGSDFRKALTESGFGNHPEMGRVFRRIGEMVGEDGFIAPSGAPKTETPVEARWYQNEKEG